VLPEPSAPDWTEDDVTRLAEILVEAERVGVIPGSRTYARRLLVAGVRMSKEVPDAAADPA
jgi:hypothetical protein